jgi:hypothetical protein
MTGSEPDDVVRPPVDAIAQVILQDALDDLSLVRRTGASSNLLRLNNARPPAVRQHDGLPSTLAADTEIANQQYLEDLVSIAMTSAERADNFLMQANATRAKAVRIAGVFAALATVGVAAGVLGMVMSLGGHAPDQKFVEVAGQVQSLEQQQQSANQMLADVKSEVAGQRQAITAIQQTASATQTAASDPQEPANHRVIIVPGGPPIIATPLSPLREAAYSVPGPEPKDRAQSTSNSTWPQPPETAQTTSSPSLWPSRPYTTHPTSTPQSRRAQPPGFLVAIQRGLRTLFR